MKAKRKLYDELDQSLKQIKCELKVRALENKMYIIEKRMEAVMRVISILGHSPPLHIPNGDLPNPE